MQASNWSRESLAWLAGLLEGEGCFMFRNDGRFHQLVIAMNMTDEDVVRQAALIAGVGRVNGPYEYNDKKHPNNKPFWKWTVTVSEHSYALMVAVYPWMGSRRRAKIREVLTCWLDWKAS